MELLLLLHVPPAIVLLSVVVLPEQTKAVPVMAAPAFTVSTRVAAVPHPVL
jgi:hypothetical protein